MACRTLHGRLAKRQVLSDVKHVEKSPKGTSAAQKFESVHAMAI
jgi:hypothetical protein